MDRTEIIKALECCISGDDCTLCPLCDEQSCPCVLNENALALIKELTEENEAWQKQLISYKEKADKAYYDLACEVENLRAENERLKKHEIVYETPFGKQTMPDILSLDGKLAELYKRIENKIKADTVREMHSLIKERCIKGGIYPAFVASTIEKVAKELLGE